MSNFQIFRVALIQLSKLIERKALIFFDLILILKLALMFRRSCMGQSWLKYERTRTRKCNSINQNRSKRLP